MCSVTVGEVEDVITFGIITVARQDVIQVLEASNLSREICEKEGMPQTFIAVVHNLNG